MSKKIKKNKKDSGLAKLILLSTLALVVIVFASVSITSFVKKKKAEKTVRVAFYGLPEEYCTLLQEYIPKEEKIELKCDILSEGGLDLGAVKEKYDMLFTWKGEVTDVLAASSTEIPAKILETMPSSLRDKKCVPILLDHCEFAYSKDVLGKLTGNISNNFAGFLNYLNQAKNYVFSPFFCLGADDRIFTAFLGSMVEAQGGLQAYNKLIEVLKTDAKFDVLIDTPLNASNLTLRSVLDMLKTWPKEGLTHPSWYNGNGNDLVYFAEDNHLGVFFTYLSEHRKIPYQIISGYESLPLPMMSATSEYGIIAPAVSAMLLSSNDNAKRYLYEFFTEEAQAELSDKTMLAPVHSRAQAFDRQADDVRFWAASCAGGALPDLYLSVYQRNPSKMAEFATNCRIYIR